MLSILQPSQEIWGTVGQPVSIRLSRQVDYLQEKVHWHAWKMPNTLSGRPLSRSSLTYRTNTSSYNTHTIVQACAGDQ